MAENMITFGCVFFGVISATILLPILFRRRRMFTSWNLFLAGSAAFVGYSAIETVTAPVGYLEHYTDNDYYHFMLGATVLYSILYFTYYFVRIPRRLAARTLRKWPAASPRQLMVLVAPLCSALALVYLVLPRIPFITPLLSNFSTPLAISALVFCVYAWERNGWNPATITSVTLAGLAALILVLSGGTGRRALFSMLLAVVATLYWLKWRNQSPGKNAIRLVAAFFGIVLVIGGYSSFRHWQKLHYADTNPFKRAVKSMTMLPRAIADAPLFNQMISGQAAVESSLVAIHNYRGQWEPEPFHTVKMIAVNPIPRVWWKSKPEALGLTLPRDIGRWKFGYINWGPGIVGHMFHEGGYPIMLFYGILLGFCFAYFDELLVQQPENPYLLAILGSISGQLLAFSRGDIAVFGVQVVAGVVAIILISIMGRMILGTRLFPSENNRPRQQRQTRSVLSRPTAPAG